MFNMAEKKILIDKFFRNIQLIVAESLGYN